MNTMSPAHTPLSNERVGDVAERVAHKADDALVGAKRVAANAAQSVQSGLDDLRDRVPGAMSRAAAQCEDLTRRGLDRARSRPTTCATAPPTSAMRPSTASRTSRSRPC
jgi:hypothetical protein